MARVKEITPEAIELLRGKVDFYLLRGILPVARSWPKKPKPPYTALQAEAMAVFAIANKSMHRLNTNILKKWQLSTVGKRPSWTDVYRAIIMKYWKKERKIAPIAINYEVFETGTEVKVSWEVLQLFIDPTVPEETYNLATRLINKNEIEIAEKPIYFTLTDDTKQRLVAPYILYKGKP